MFSRVVRIATHLSVVVFTGPGSLVLQPFGNETIHADVRGVVGQVYDIGMLLQPVAGVVHKRLAHSLPLPGDAKVHEKTQFHQDTTPLQGPSVCELVESSPFSSLGVGIPLCSWGQKKKQTHVREHERRCLEKYND